MNAPSPDEHEIEILRALSPARKLDVMHGLIRQAYELKAAALRASHPEWTEDRIRTGAWKVVAGEHP